MVVGNGLVLKVRWSLNITPLCALSGGMWGDGDGVARARGRGNVSLPPPPPPPPHHFSDRVRTVHLRAARGGPVAGREVRKRRGTKLPQPEAGDPPLGGEPRGGTPGISPIIIPNGPRAEARGDGAPPRGRIPSGYPAVSTLGPWGWGGFVFATVRVMRCVRNL